MLLTRYEMYTSRQPFKHISRITERINRETESHNDEYQCCQGEEYFGPCKI